MLTEPETRAGPPFRVPADTRIYAIGDIHGRIDLLGELHDRILDDGKGYPGRRVIVYLGDYIDRGPHSPAVLDAVRRKPLNGFEHVCLKGNHEDHLLKFLDDPGDEIGIWLRNGGGETMVSYGVDAGPGRPAEAVRDDLARALPPEHLSFMRTLPVYHDEGGYRFVHAGLRPGVPLSEQSDHDMIWIRDEFLDHPEPFEKRVVHGHTICLAPEVSAVRIGIDTGAYMTGVLTSVVLEGADVRFLAAAAS